MVARQVGTEGAAGGELRGGRRFGSDWGFGLRWFPIEAEALGSSARSWGVERWRWKDGGGSVRDEWDRRAGVEEDGYQPPIAG